MDELFVRFESIVRRAYEFNDARSMPDGSHPFDERDIHSILPDKCKRLFDDGHYAEATFEALKYFDKQIQKLSGCEKSGTALMMAVFGGKSPKMRLNGLQSQTDRDEQEGYKFILAGMMTGLRNPRGHEYAFVDDPDTCLDHLTMISHAIRRIEAAGYRFTA